MRKTLLVATVAAAAFTATPALAQTAGSPSVDGAVQALQRVVDSVLSVPVGGIAAAADPLGRRGGVYPNDTVGSVLDRHQPGAEQRIREQIRSGAETAHATARTVARMLPVLERTAEDLRRNLDAAIAAADAD